jgi:hypothetical protein
MHVSKRKCSPNPFRKSCPGRRGSCYSSSCFTLSGEGPVFEGVEAAAIDPVSPFRGKDLYLKEWKLLQ